MLIDQLPTTRFNLAPDSATTASFTPCEGEVSERLCVNGGHFGTIQTSSGCPMIQD